MTKQVTLTIDNREISVPAGTLIVDAAKKAGIDIPVFCYHPKMEPVGMCRMCLVDVGRPVRDRATGELVLEEDGSPKIQFGWKLETSCTVPVSEGMVVVTDSDKVENSQTDVLEFLLTSRPLDCPVCDKGGECALQNLAMEHGPTESRFIYDEKQHAEKRVSLGDLIYLDRERCIQCARCIRFQSEIAGDPVLQFYSRGRSTDIITVSDPAFDSYWSGNTTDLCPVGALTTADFRFSARPWELKSAASICTHCAVGCNLTYNTRREAKSGGEVVIKRAMPRQNEQVNELWICDKGRFAYHFAGSENRLTQPLIRRDGELVPASWDEALTLAAEKLAAAGNGLLTLVGGRLPNEDLYTLDKLTTALGGKIGLYTYMAGGDLTARYGLSAGSNLGDLGKGDAILVVASDLEEEAPLWYLRVKQAAERGATLIVANPRETKLDRYAAHNIRYAYGEETEAVRQAAAAQFAEAQNAVIFFGSEGLGLAGSAALAQACADLLVETGHIGRPNNGLVGVWERANEQGAWELGIRPVTDLSADVLYIAAADPFGDNPALRTSNPEQFVIVQELFLTETAKLADVVFPAQAQVEREGTFTSGERRVQRFHPVVAPKGESLPDFQIAAKLGAKAGIELKGGFPSLIFPQIAAEIPAYEGITYRKLAEVTEQWPIVGGGDLYYGGTSYKNEQGLGVHLALHPDGDAEPWSAGTAASKSADALLAVPVTRLYDRGATLTPSNVLEPRLSHPFVALNPSDAEAQRAADGMKVNVGVNGASAPVTVRVDETVPAGFALLPRSMGIPLDGPTEVIIQLVEVVQA